MVCYVMGLIRPIRPAGPCSGPSHRSVTARRVHLMALRCLGVGLSGWTRRSHHSSRGRSPRGQACMEQQRHMRGTNLLVCAVKAVWGHAVGWSGCCDRPPEITKVRLRPRARATLPPRGSGEGKANQRRIRAHQGRSFLLVRARCVYSVFSRLPLRRSVHRCALIPFSSARPSTVQLYGCANRKPVSCGHADGHAL